MLGWLGQEPGPSKCVFLSTSRAVRKDMREWVVSDEGHNWTVKLDVRDLGGHLDTTFRGWSSTLAARVLVVIARLIVVHALPLSFHGRLGVLRSMFIPGALHGIEASFLADCSVRKLRSAVLQGFLGPVGGLLLMWVLFSVCWMVLLVVTLLFVLFGFVLGNCVGIWLFGLRRFLGFIGCSRLLLKGPLVMGLRILLLESAAEIGFFWCSRFPGWDRPGLPVLSMVDGPIQHFRAAILDAWRHKVSMGFCARKGFRGGPFLDVSGTLQLLNSDHVRERDKALLGGVLVGGVWNGFFVG